MPSINFLCIRNTSDDFDKSDIFVTLIDIFDNEQKPIIVFACLIIT